MPEENERPDPSPDTWAEHWSPRSRREYHPRDADEWQGMLVDISSPIGCEDFCGLALACIDSECLPCASDEDCLEGEGCALDHCVLVDNLECRSRHDCPGDELCLLSG
jgi:hypothetical protein